jgi:hypothetical protein
MEGIRRRYVQACYLCGSQAFAPLGCDGDLRFGYPGTYHVVACAVCGFVFTADPPESEILSRWYADGYGSKDYSEPVRHVDNLTSFLRRLMSRQVCYSGSNDMDLVGGGPSGTSFTSWCPSGAEFWMLVAVKGF